MVLKNIRNRMTAMILTLVIALSMTTVPAFAEDSQIVVTGDFQPTLIAFSIPSTTNLTLNPNGTTPEERVIASNLTIVNNSTAPLEVSIDSISIDVSSEHVFDLVAPDKYADWTSLGRTISESEIAVGVKVISGFDRNIANNTIWSTDISGTAVKIGEIDAGQNGVITTDVKFGNAIGSALSTKIVEVIKIGLAQ